MFPIQSIEELFNLIKRRKLIIGLIFLLGSIATVFYAKSLPHVYSSSEVIQIQSPRITDELAPSTVNGSSARRMQLIEQQLMSRGPVMEIIEQHQLYDNLPNLTDTEKVALFRSGVFIEGVAAAREGFADDGTISVLRISAEAGTPEKAQAVAHELATRTIELSENVRLAATQATLDFFLNEEQVLLAEIAEFEAEFTAYRNQNENLIAGQAEFQQIEVAALNDSLNNVSQSRIAAQRELSSLAGSDDTTRIEELNRRLENLAEQEEFFRGRLEALQEDFFNLPEVERTVAAYERRLEQYQDQLEEITAKRSEAEIGLRLEESKQAEQLQVLETAFLPEDPVRPSRRKIAAMGVVVSLMAALGIAVLLDLLRPVIRSSAQMERELGIVPAIVIPERSSVRRNRGNIIVRFFKAIINFFRRVGAISFVITVPELKKN